MTEIVETAEVYAGLRRQVIDLRADQLGGEFAQVPILALLMENGYEQAVATLVAVADGTTSLYFSTGGGIIGAGAHESVAQANGRWLETGAAFLEQLEPVADPQLPAAGQTQFVAVTNDGLRAAVVPEQDLRRNRHALSPLFYAAQDVIAQVRLIEGG
jgi:hypothetical protein